MNKVYIVMTIENKTNHICAVFSDKTKAQKYCKDCSENSANDYWIDAWRVDAIE